jgi:hypothetical protein
MSQNGKRALNIMEVLRDFCVAEKYQVNILSSLLVLIMEWPGIDASEPRGRESKSSTTKASTR